MTWLRILPMVVACVLMAAHLYRWDLWPQALLALLAPLLLLTRTPSVVLPLKWMLGVFALEWVRTAWVLATARMQEGLPTARTAGHPAGSGPADGPGRPAPAHPETRLAARRAFLQAGGRLLTA